jgi:phage terminase large subunit-like protein
MPTTTRVKTRAKLSTADTLLYAAEAEECRRSLRAFVRSAWGVLEPGRPLTWNWHMDALIEHLQAVMDGQITRLVINIAPGHTKSTIVSDCFTAWCWTRRPELRMLCASTDLQLALRDNRNTRFLIESDWYRACYGRDFKLNTTTFDMSEDQNMKSFFENDRKGYRLGMSVGAKGIGRRGDLLLIDDPHDPREGDKGRIEVLEWYRQTWVSRLNDQEHGPMIIVGQRIHDEDLCGLVLKQGGWEHLCLPEEYEPARRCTTSIGWCDPRDQEGELLWPEKFGPSVIDTLKKSHGALGYAAQYQQSPIPTSGGQFKEEWLRYFSVEGDYYRLQTPQGIQSVAIKDCWRFSVVDLAISTRQSADYTVIQTYDVTPRNDLLLIDQVRGHFDNPTQQKEIRKVYFRLKPQFVQIETIAYQLAIVQQLRDEPVEAMPFNEHPPQVGDFLVKTGDAAMLDRTLRALPGMHAFVLKDDNGQYVSYFNRWVVRVQGDLSFFRWALEQQGYGTIEGFLEERDVQEIESLAKRRFSIPLREYRPVRDKVSRASSPAILMENGKFYLFEKLPDLPEIKTEILRFPKAANDDIVDCISQAAEVILVPAGPLLWSPDDEGLPPTVIRPLSTDLAQSRSPETAPTAGQPHLMLTIDDPCATWPPIMPDEGVLVEWELPE